MTQEKLAEKATLSTRYLQAVEKGDNWLSVAKLSRLRNALGCEWNDLLKGV